MEINVLYRLSDYYTNINKILIFTNINKIVNNIEFIDSDSYINSILINKINLNCKYNLILDNCKFKLTCDKINVYNNIIKLLNINGLFCSIDDTNSICVYSPNFYKCIFNEKYGMELIGLYNANENDTFNDWIDIINDDTNNIKKQYFIIFAKKINNSIFNVIDNEPNYNIIPNKNKILFISAYIKIDDNINQLDNLNKLLLNNINLIFFCEKDTEDILHNTYNFYNTLSYDKNNTYYNLFENYNNITNSDFFKNLIKTTNYELNNNFIENNIINHNKIMLIDRIKKLYPNYNYYGWIDLKYLQNTQIVDYNFDWDNLPNKIHYGSTLELNTNIIPDILNNFILNPEIIYNNLFTIPYNLVNWYLDKYNDMINYFNCLNIIGNDKDIICQLYKLYPNNFNFYNCNKNYENLLLLYNKYIEKPLKVAFLCDELCNEKNMALYNYALYCKKLYNNDSIIFYYKNCLDINKFNFEFKCYEINNIIEIDNIIIANNITHLYYIITDTINESALCNNAFNLLHLLNDIEINISNNKKYIYSNFSDYSIINKEIPILYNILNNNIDTNNYRNDLDIPYNAIVIGRYGLYNEFNILEVYEAIIDILNSCDNIYFLFINTQPFHIHSRIIYIDNINIIDKIKYLNTCDAMIHAKIDGEIFSIEIAEFSLLNKPIITCNIPNINIGHINILQDKAIYYNNKDSLINIFYKLKDILKLNYDWNAFKSFLPDEIMKNFFNNLFNKN